MFTKKTRIKWATVEDQLGNDAFNTQRVIKIDEMVAAEKTDGLPVPITDLITERYWIDEVSAQEYIDFVLLKADIYNLTVVSSQILDAT
jgi:hypothetical protein